MKTTIQSAAKEAAIALLILVMLGSIATLIRKFVVSSNAAAFGSGFATFVDTKLTFIGVIHHELSHLTLAILTGAKVKNVNLFKLHGNTLGSVDIITRGPFFLRSIQYALSGCAPIICGAITLYIIYYFGIQKSTGYTKLIFVILSAMIAYHMNMSSADLKAAILGLPLTFIILTIIFIFVKIDYSMLYKYLTTILCVMSINLVFAVLVRIFAVFKNIIASR